MTITIYDDDMNEICSHRIEASSLADEAFINELQDEVGGYEPVDIPILTGDPDWDLENIEGQDYEQNGGNRSY